MSAPQQHTPQEGKEKAEEVMTRLREAGLTLRVRKHLGKVPAASTTSHHIGPLAPVLTLP